LNFNRRAATLKPVTNPDEIVEHIPPLDAVPGCRAAFLKRVPGVDVRANKAKAIHALETAHRETRRRIGFGEWPLLTTEQVHGNEIAVIDAPIEQDQHLTGYDGFITNQHQVGLGIYVADCCAVYIVDPKTPAVGLIHSGKKGTQLGIAIKAIQKMQQQFGSVPADLIVYLSPCIRPPHYEVDFAAEIRQQCRSAGVQRVHDSGVCTACDLKSYYSYRAEKGQTGRMLALLGLVEVERNLRAHC
jgi:copper oxidase (laccase) domain-containing protein